MNTSLTHLQCLLAIGVCIWMHGQICADQSTLASNSPFLPPGYSNQKPQVSASAHTTVEPLSREIEFRGIVQFGGVYQFSLFNKKDKKGYWIEENHTENGLSVSNFDLDTMRITVTFNGRSEPLTLINATDSPLPVASAPPVALPDQVKPAIPGLTPGATKPATTRRTLPRRRRVILPKKP